MKKILFIIGFSLLFSIKGNTQQQEHKNTINFGFGSYMISQNSIVNKYDAYKPIKCFRPTIDVSYHRFVWEGFWIGFGYSYTKTDPNAHLGDGHKIQCISVTNALMFYLSYKIRIRSFSITPYMAIGPASIAFKYDVDLYFENNRYTEFIQMPGIRLEYILNGWFLYLSYNINYYKTCPKEKDNIAVPAMLSFPARIVNHDFKIGLGWSF